MKKDIFIVMIEDDQDLRDGWSDLFEMLGYDCQVFQHGQDFLEDKTALDRCTLLITDYYLPGLNGVELIRKFRELKPEAAALLLTGSRENFIAESLRPIPNSALMHKPLDIEEIEAHIHKVFAA
jgi:FixJ family two-component response regulator